MDMDEAKRRNILKDRISGMPDEILCRVLLLLPMKGVRSSILSRRWRYIWKASLSFLSCLTLDVLSMRGSDYPMNIFAIFEDINFIKEDSELLSSEKLKFINWVYQILQLLDYSSNSPAIDSFRLRFYLNKDFAYEIDRWISLAISKRVQNLDIDLSQFDNSTYRFPRLELYTFPDWLFSKETEGSLLKSLCLKSCILRPLDFNSFTSLLDLQLDHVVINQDSFDSFLSQCCNLQKLRMVECWQLNHLKISSAEKLSDLGVIYCTILNYIEIDAINLSRLEFRGDEDKIIFVNVPNLSNVIIFLRNISNDDYYSAYVTVCAHDLSSYVPKLECLMLAVIFFKNPFFPTNFRFTKLNKLVLMTIAYEGTLWGLIPFLNASPLLDTLELDWELMRNFRDCDLEELMVKPCDYPHHNLKNITISKFQGSDHEVEFTTYLLNNTKSLEKITIYYARLENYNFMQGDCTLKLTETLPANKMEEQSCKQLIKLLPPGVEFILM